MWNHHPLAVASCSEWALVSEQHRVLVVDDERGIQIVLQEILELEGYAVRVASDGAEALAALAQWRPHVILLDLMMPRMDGSAFRAEQQDLASDLRDIPVVVVSGARDAQQRADAVQAAALIPKPFDLDDITNTVRSVIEKHPTG